MAMVKNVGLYFSQWWGLITRPIFFFYNLPKADWREDAFSFHNASVWVLSIMVALTVFITKYVAIGAYLIENLHGSKVIIVLPIIIMIALVFYGITLGVVAGVLQVLSHCFFFSMGWVFDFIVKKFKGKDELQASLNVSYYSSGVLVFLAVAALIAIMVYENLLPTEVLHAGISLVLYFSLIYIYGIWSIGLKVRNGLSKAQAFLAAGIPTIFLLLVLIVVDWKVLDKVLAKLI